MPLPLFIPIAMAAAALFGLGKTAKAVCDSSKATDIASDAQNYVDQATQKLEKYKEVTNTSLATYGKKKLAALDRQVQPFVTLFKQLKNVELVSSAELDNLKIGKFSEVTVGELQHTCIIAHGALEGVGAGTVGGALTAFGAYSGTMMLASAGTGTAISALSGVAATNATMAWLGGGTLAAGGMGVAGGTMVLGTLIAGPALLIFGSVLGAKASAKLSEARSNSEKAQAFKVEIDGVCQKLMMIKTVSDMASDVLSNLRGKLRKANESLEQVINANGIDFSMYDDNVKGIVFKSVKYAQLVKAMIDTPILNEDGEILGNAESQFSEIKAAIE